MNVVVSSSEVNSHNITGIVIFREKSFQVSQYKKQTKDCSFLIKFPQGKC